MFRFKKPASATYSAPSTTAAALDITFTANAPTPSTSQTVADGQSPTVVETGQFMANVEDVLAKLVADVADLKTSLGKAAADDADLREVLQEPN